MDKYKIIRCFYYLPRLYHSKILFLIFIFHIQKNNLLWIIKHTQTRNTWTFPLVYFLFQLAMIRLSFGNVELFGERNFRSISLSNAHSPLIFSWDGQYETPYFIIFYIDSPFFIVFLGVDMEMQKMIKDFGGNIIYPYCMAPDLFEDDDNIEIKVYVGKQNQKIGGAPIDREDLNFINKQIATTVPYFSGDFTINKSPIDILYNMNLADMNNIFKLKGIHRLEDITCKNLTKISKSSQIGKGTYGTAYLFCTLDEKMPSYKKCEFVVKISVCINPQNFENYVIYNDNIKNGIYKDYYNEIMERKSIIVKKTDTPSSRLSYLKNENEEFLQKFQLSEIDISNNIDPLLLSSDNTHLYPKGVNSYRYFWFLKTRLKYINTEDVSYVAFIMAEYIKKKNPDDYISSVVSYFLVLDAELQSGIKNQKDEMDITNKASDYGFAPRIYKSFYCKPNKCVLSEDLIKGVSLSNILKNNLFTIDIATKFFETLEKLHNLLGTGHGDLNPQNIIFDLDETFRFIDFSPLMPYRPFYYDYITFFYYFHSSSNNLDITIIIYIVSHIFNILKKYTNDPFIAIYVKKYQEFLLSSPADDDYRKFILSLHKITDWLVAVFFF